MRIIGHGTNCIGKKNGSDGNYIEKVGAFIPRLIIVETSRKCVLTPKVSGSDSRIVPGGKRTVRSQR
jgi:hypothetical protein